MCTGKNVRVQAKIIKIAIAKFKNFYLNMFRYATPDQ